MGRGPESNQKENSRGCPAESHPHIHLFYREHMLGATVPSRVAAQSPKAPASLLHHCSQSELPPICPDPPLLSLHLPTVLSRKHPLTLVSVKRRPTRSGSQDPQCPAPPAAVLATEQSRFQ